MIADKLRKAILRDAVSGHLTDQLTSDGHARELIAKIQTEKGRLGSARRLKKESLSPIQADEIPFEIPANWVWATFGDLVVNRDSERRPITKADRVNTHKRFDYYGASGVIDQVDDYIFDEELLLIGEDGANLLTRRTPVAFIARGRYWVNNHAHVLQPLSGMHIQYLEAYVNSVDLFPYVTGTAQPKMNQRRMNAIPVPVPPEAEQRRIVARMNELLPQVDKLRKHEAKIEVLRKRFPGDMRNAILQDAVSGRLTDQSPSDGNALELLTLSREQKAKMVEAGEIKKESPISPLSDEEIPFDVPANWTWVRLGELCVLNPRNSAPDDSLAGFLPMARLSDGYGSACNFEVRRWGDVRSGYSHFAVGDLVIAKITPCFQNRKSAVIEALEPGIGAGTTEVHVVRGLGGAIDVKYLLYFFKTAGFIRDGVNAMTGTAGQQRVGTAFLRDCPLPLPPLAEQKRIVERLNRLLPLCEALV